MTIRELPPGQTARAHAAMRALRPRWPEAAAWAAHVDGVQRAEGYRLVAAFAQREAAEGDPLAEGDPPAEDDPPAEGEAAVAVAGFRVTHHLAWGRTLYVDDLSTLPAARGRGHGRALLDWLAEEARRLGCDELHLDSGFGPQRADAHRLYLNTGLAVSSLHFARAVR